MYYYFKTDSEIFVGKVVGINVTKCSKDIPKHDEKIEYTDTIWGRPYTAHKTVTVPETTIKYISLIIGVNSDNTDIYRSYNVTYLADTPSKTYTAYWYTFEDSTEAFNDINNLINKAISSNKLDADEISELVEKYKAPKINPDKDNQSRWLYVENN